MLNTLHIISLQEMVADNHNHQDNSEFVEAFHARSLGLLSRSWKKKKILIWHQKEKKKRPGTVTLIGAIMQGRSCEVLHKRPSSHNVKEGAGRKYAED